MSGKPGTSGISVILWALLLVCGRGLRMNRRCARSLNARSWVIWQLHQHVRTSSDHCNSSSSSINSSSDGSRRRYSNPIRVGNYLQKCVVCFLWKVIHKEFVTYILSSVGRFCTRVQRWCVPAIIMTLEENAYSPLTKQPHKTIH